MPYTFLHISDLHRAPDDPISNEVLLSSLVADFDRSASEDPPVPPPDAIVVSGDVIQGAPLGAVGHAETIREQYETALDLLAALADQFLDGDRARVIVVPGNHDVSWNDARSAMKVIDQEDAKALGSESFGPHSDLRWDWKSKTAYRIVDSDLYETRLSAYRQFVSSFYTPSPRGRADIGSDVALHELHGGAIGVAAFSSCHGNDCFNFHGAIHDYALANAHMKLRDTAPQYDLLVAVWHHNVAGPPGSSDYMDAATLDTLIGRGFRLGLHGHQHRGQVVDRRIFLPRSESITVVSAGSLCAGRRELPTGVNRQYNVLEIADDYDSLRVHVREMSVATVFAPAQRAEFGGRGWMDVALDPPLRASGPTSTASQDVRVLRAEKLFHDKRPAEALDLLRSVDIAEPGYARTLAYEAAQAAGDTDFIVRLLHPPLSVNELVSLTATLIEVGDLDQAESVLSEFTSAVGLTQPVERDLRAAINTKRALS